MKTLTYLEIRLKTGEIIKEVVIWYEVKPDKVSYQTNRDRDLLQWGDMSKVKKLILSPYK